MPDPSTGIALLAYGAIAAVVGQIITFLTVLYNGHQQRLREERSRRWEIEDRAVLAKHVEVTAEKVASKVTESASRAELAIEALSVALAENTTKTEQAAAAAHEAYKEANNVNLKIASLGIQVHETAATPVEPRRDRRQP